MNQPRWNARPAKRAGKMLLGALCVSGVLFTVTPAFAQGKSQKNKNNAPPSRNELAAAAAVSPAPVGATPLAWIDDASLLAPGVVSLSVSAMRWSGGGFSEVDFPIADVAVGLSPRLQISASVPRVVGSVESGGAAGGVGTSFFTAKVALYEHRARAIKVAAAPTMQLLGEGVVAELGPGYSRARWGLPVSAEIARGPMRLYGGSGYFSPGLWFAGAAASGPVSPKVYVSGGLSRAWRSADTPDVPLSARDRKEISGGVAYVLTPALAAFGSVARTIKTLDENGAGMSISGGVSFSFATAIR